MEACARALDEALSSSVPANQAQEQVEKAPAAEAEDIDVKGSDEYRALLEERDMLRAISGEEFKGVKPKFREQVFGMLDRSEDAPPAERQLEGIRELYEEFFLADSAVEAQQAPCFGASIHGSMPRGESGAVAEFLRVWNS